MSEYPVVSSTFNRLGERFRAIVTVESDADAVSVESTMYEAGRALFHAIRQQDLPLPDLPEWLRTHPTRLVGRCLPSTGAVEERDHHEWAMYWWSMVVWLHDTCPSSAIVLPPGRISQTKSPATWWDFYEVLRATLSDRATDGQELLLWKQIASASDGACAFLATILKTGDLYMPAEYFKQYGINSDSLRQAKHKKQIRAIEREGQRNLYNVTDVMAKWPDCFTTPPKPR